MLCNSGIVATPPLLIHEGWALLLPPTNLSHPLLGRLELFHIPLKIPAPNLNPLYEHFEAPCQALLNLVTDPQKRAHIHTILCKSRVEQHLKEGGGGRLVSHGYLGGACWLGEPLTATCRGGGSKRMAMGTFA